MQSNGSENWVHLVGHLLAKCKQPEIGSSPITGPAASKNEPSRAATLESSTNGNPCSKAGPDGKSGLKEREREGERAQLCTQRVGILLTTLHISRLVCAAADLLRVQRGRPEKLLLLFLGGCPLLKSHIHVFTSV